MYKLIIADDEAKICEGVAHLFPWKKVGFEIAGQFSNGIEVYDYLKTNSADVILCDIEMPQMSGIELCSRLSEKDSIKVVLFSSHQNYEYFRQSIKYHVEDYLLKPLKYEDLMNCFEGIREKLDRENNISESKTPGYYDKIINSVTAYIMENYKEASLEEAAQLVSLSPTYLSKIFREHSKLGFSELLLSVRMEKACEYLCKADVKMYEIAYYLGYDNPKNFTRAFKNYYNISPSDYRKEKLGS